mgnify:CR=1 FL=1
MKVEIVVDKNLKENKQNKNSRNRPGKPWYQRKNLGKRYGSPIWNLWR